MNDSSLLTSIVTCEELTKARLNTTYCGPCKKIIGVQDNQEEFQIPEPWNGHIDKAPLLFIGPNPSIDEKEQYPNKDWDMNAVRDYFENRFEGKWTRDLKILLRSGAYSNRPVRFWTSIRARTAELLGKSKDQVIPGTDFSVTEVVHCKSRESEGVKESLEYCSSKFLRKTIEQSAALVIFLLGDEPAKGFCRIYREKMPLNEMKNVIGPIEISGKKRYLVFLPHPNQIGKTKTLEGNLSQESFNELRKWVLENDF
ncbi:MAG: uracil-DNA glycosylase family protein [Leptospirales bacterium]